MPGGKGPCSLYRSLTSLIRTSISLADVSRTHTHTHRYPTMQKLQAPRRPSSRKSIPHRTYSEDINDFWSSIGAGRLGIDAQRCKSFCWVFCLSGWSVLVVAVSGGLL